MMMNQRGYIGKVVVKYAQARLRAYAKANPSDRDPGAWDKNEKPAWWVMCE